ncbi:putative dynactin subunit 2 [Zancudomyces culisetae]|uniref:Putative dynactin subunit 2 n=2 Tax=Zancudomyces culisetae TaxID=1213189 RepID=A0A1R1PNS4_ZANCU|nr:putative dynactin subunit 2 [Zancudomyces culisetae]|eukprot:OMH82617.1 putative dynactin subunit 2 [Zancudomyces culisetae]
MSTANSSKYHGLPDVAFDQPDVYETPDVQEKTEPELNINFVTENKELDIHNLDIKDAKNYFGIKDKTNSDKENSAEKYRRALYKSYLLENIENEISVYPSTKSQYNEGLFTETPLEKLTRLTFEIQDLQSSLENDDKIHNKEKIASAASELKQNLEAISEQRDRLSSDNGKIVSSALWDRLNSSSSKKSTGEAFAENSDQKQRLEIPISEFESRISRLEAVLGCTTDNLDQSKVVLCSYTKNLMLTTPSITERLDTLNGQISLLSNPANLDSISRRAKQISVDLEKLDSLYSQVSQKSSESEASSGVDTSKLANTNTNPRLLITKSNLEKIDSLFENIPRYEFLLSVLPGLMNRLENLNQIHTKAADLVSSFESSVQASNVNDAKLKELKEVCGNLELSISSNKAVMESNIKSLEERILKLNDKTLDKK